MQLTFSHSQPYCLMLAVPYNGQFRMVRCIRREFIIRPEYIEEPEWRQFMGKMQ